MRAYTIVVQPAAEQEGLIATVPDLPGWAAGGRTVEECVERAREVIGLFVEGLDPAGGPMELSGRPAAAPIDADEEEAADALRRATAALRTVESQLEEEITRRTGGQDRRPLRRAHAVILRARRALVEEQRRAGDRALV
ncbi:MAG TPA: type II toxin-antitoxin system HicB family antitoxin [Candidatus Dormibacteraeota bacterium]|nr:type II toxin-antitoxin system HicB family antitoxin [Candidatus Dormibacteraeota bacterium]